ncbi:MAG: restriction endonuclease subunit S [Sulfurimonadaceae bacterium]
MSRLSFLERLLEGAAVEWKTLGEVGEVRMCKRILKSQTSSEGEIPFYKIGTFGKKPDAYISRKLFEEYKAKYNYPKIGEILISASGTIGRTVIFDGSDAYFQDSNIVWIENDESQVLNKYLFHFYKIAKWAIADGGTIQRLYNDNIKKTQIPIPPLAVQGEIVRILDNFTLLTAELTAELTARRKQYAYYRDRLLSFTEEQAEWKTLGEVGELVRGNGLPKTDFTETGVPAIHYGQIYTHYGVFATKTKSFVSSETAKKLKKVNTGDVVITNTSENLEDVGKAVVYLGEIQAVTGGHATIFKPSNHVLGKYFAYFTQTVMFANEKRKYAKGTKVIDVSATDMAKIKIPIPPLAEQERIVAILDKFDALTNSITEGLPREIELRQKQYEYYRDLLLSFQKGDRL